MASDPGGGRAIPLFESARERRRVSDMADLYAIIKATEHLEKAYARDAVDDGAYEAACLKLVSQFKSSEAALRHDGTIADGDAFMTAWRVDCPRARERLLRRGVPATIARAAAGTGGDAALRVAECVQAFITAMDALKLDLRAVDEVQPLVADVAAALARVPRLRCGAGAAALASWLADLGALRAADEIDDARARQLAFDLDAAYAEFHRALAARAE